MTATLSPDVLQDQLAVSVARALAAANQRAQQDGVNVSDSRISISQRTSDDRWFWRINYGPKNYVGRRGGDYLVEVDAATAGIEHVLRGQ
jgi:hypothetical protein